MGHFEKRKMNNPALASTAEFGNFVNERLQTSKKAFSARVSSSDPKASSRSSKPPTVSRPNRDIPAAQSQNFFVDNSAKYIDSSKPARVGSQANRGRPAAKPAEIPFVHSWRAHLDYKRSPSPLESISIPLPQFDMSMASPFRRRDLHIVQSPFDALRRAALSPRKRGTDDALSPQPSPLRAFPVPCNRAVEPDLSFIRYRSKVLSRCFARWRAAKNILHQNSSRLVQQVDAVHRRHELTVILRDWRAACRAIHFQQRFVRFRGQLLLRSWKQRARRSSLLQYYSARHYCMNRLAKAFAVLRNDVRSKRQKSRMLKVKQSAARYRVRSLQQRCFLAWRRCSRLAAETKRIEDESKQRKDKIQSFIQNVSMKSDAKDTTSRSASRGSVRPPPSSRLNGTADAKGNGPTRSGSAMRSVVPPTSSAAQSKTTSRLLPSPRGAKIHEHSPVPPVPPAPPTLQLEFNSSDSIPSAPPSYSQFVDDQAFGEANAKDKAQAASSRMAFDERSRQHKERLLMLRQRANDNVLQKQKEDLKIKQEKERKEEQEAERLRDEARQRKEEEKLKSARGLAMQAELRRLLEKAKKFRDRQLLVRVGLAPWRRFVERSKDLEDRALQFCHRRLKESVWHALSGYISSVRSERMRKEHRQSAQAAAHYKRSLGKRVLHAWKLYRKMLKAKAIAVMGEFSRFTLRKRGFQAWKVSYERAIRETARAMQAVAPRGRRSVLQFFWKKWLGYHKERLEDREIQMRADHKWAAVQSWMHK